MDRAFASGSSASPPSAPGSPSIGYATAGNPGSGTPATKPGPYWYHMVTEELRGIIAAAGLTPSQSDITQLLQALPAALASRPEMARSLAANGYQKLPGGLILQWGTSGSISAGGTLAVTLPIAFPNNNFSAVCMAQYSSGPNATYMVSIYGRTLSNMSFYNGNTGVALIASWLAIGN